MGENVVQLFKALGDETRLRIVRLLHREELNVQEIGQILEIPQPSVSRHLAVLKSAGVVSDRRDGTKIFYTMEDHSGTLRSVDSVMREVAETDHPDLGRLAGVVAARAQDTKRFMDEQAEHWEEIVGMLHNSAASLLALANMVPRGMIIGDLGTGTGLFLPVLSAMAEEVHAADQSAALLRRARNRCRQAELNNVVFHHADLADLPEDFPQCDALLLHFVLHQIASPAALLKKLSAVLKLDGRLIIVDRCEHDDERAKQQFGSLWLGFSREKIEHWLKESGLKLLFWDDIPGKGSGDAAFATFVCAAGLGRLHKAET